MILKADELVNLKSAVIHKIVLPAKKNISISVLRIDKIHAIISGNKWFKLKYNLDLAINQKKNHIITFGGAWSNHIVATAYLCEKCGLRSTGFIRGEKPGTYSASLTDAVKYQMQLRFVSREEYRNKPLLIQSIKSEFPEAFIIEEGGQNAEGIKGAMEIMDLADDDRFSHIICAVGTGTMMAGLINASSSSQKIIGIPVLKLAPGNNDVESFIVNSAAGHTKFELLYNYHFGGYAKYTDELISFMNWLYRENEGPTDIVYTGKLFFAVNDLIMKNHFPDDSRILIVHSGGLQGNRSMPENILQFGNS